MYITMHMRRHIMLLSIRLIIASDPSNYSFVLFAITKREEAFI